MKSTYIAALRDLIIAAASGTQSLLAGRTML